MKSKERYVIELMNHLQQLSEVDKRLEADRLVTSVIYIRSQIISQIRNQLDWCKKIINSILTLVQHLNDIYSVVDLRATICGSSTHSKNKEAFFIDAEYEFDNINSKINCNVPCITNENQNVKKWLCTN